MIDSSAGDANKKFMMGEFEAEFPIDFQYAKNHMWAIVSPEDPTLIRFGFAAYRRSPFTRCLFFRLASRRALENSGGSRNRKH